jgi:hypothetical protein
MKTIIAYLLLTGSAMAGILIAVPGEIWNELPPGKRNAVIQSCKEWTGEETAVDTNDTPYAAGAWMLIHFHPGQTPHATAGKLASLQGILGPDCTVTNTSDPIAVLYEIGAWPEQPITNGVPE